MMQLNTISGEEFGGSRVEPGRTRDMSGLHMQIKKALVGASSSVKGGGSCPSVIMNIVVRMAHDPQVSFAICFGCHGYHGLSCEAFGLFDGRGETNEK